MSQNPFLELEWGFVTCSMPIFRLVGVLFRGVPPVLIPNTEVKAPGPDDTWPKLRPGKVGYADIPKYWYIFFALHGRKAC